MTRDQGNSGDHLSVIVDPLVALEYLAGDFFGPRVATDAQLVASADVPSPFDALLVHHEHMTTALERYHGGTVRLEVIEDRLAGDLYHRKILLTTEANHVVEVGLVRMNLGITPAEVRQEILLRKQPLGEILIRHEVLRRIEPKWFFRLDGVPSIVAAFDRPLDGPVYGRVGIIHCNGEPAIELLEVVSADKSP